MPGKHSPGVLADRRLRALRRGFLHVRPPGDDVQYVAVKREVAGRAKAQAKALATHHDLNKAAGQSFHFAAHAALAARSIIGEKAFVTAKAVIKAINTARHSWADISFDSDDSGAASAPVTSCGDCSGSVDPLTVHDPWAKAASWLPGCSSSTVSTLRAEACSFLPSGDSYIYRPSDVASELDKTVQVLVNLVEAQNNTFAVLSHRLDTRLPATSRGVLSTSDDVLVKFAQLESQINQLSKSMGNAVQASVHKRTVHLQTQLDQLSAVRDSFNAKFEVINECVNDKFSLAVEQCVQSAASQIKDVSGKIISGVGDLVKKVEGRFHNELADACEELRASCSGPNISTKPSAGHIATKSSAGTASLTAGYKANDGGTVLGSLTPVTSCGDYAGGGISFVDSEHEYFVGDYVRLHGLKTASLNGKVGTITEYIESSGRFGVVLHRRSEPKAVLKTNIQRYEPVLGELCGDCNDVLNLFSFPPCSCSPSVMVSKDLNKHTTVPSTTSDTARAASI